MLSALRDFLLERRVSLSRPLRRSPNLWSPLETVHFGVNKRSDWGTLEVDSDLNLHRTPEAVLRALKFALMFLDVTSLHFLFACPMSSVSIHNLVYAIPIMCMEDAFSVNEEFYRETMTHSKLNVSEAFPFPSCISRSRRIIWTCLTVLDILLSPRFTLDTYLNLYSHIPLSLCRFIPEGFMYVHGAHQDK